MSKQSSIKINLTQNNPDFELEPLEDQPPLFKFKYLKKTLNPIQDNPEEVRYCTVKCLIRGCS